jgi:hypothetical protein
MERSRLPWVWIAPILMAFAHWQRTYASRIWGDSVEGRYVAERILPYFWTTVAIALLILLVFGRRREALGPWLFAAGAFTIGWLVPTS